METPALDPRLPPPAAPLGVRPARDHGSDARRQAFERAMQRRAGKQAPDAGTGRGAPPVRAPQTAGLTHDDDGQLHVDVLA